MTDLQPASAKTASQSCFRIGDAVCELSTGLIWRGGREDRLEPRLKGVLALLIQRASDVISRDEFLDLVWDGEGSDEALTQSISRLRRLLGDAGAIKTHPRIGYSLAMTPETADPAGRVQAIGERSTVWSVRRTLGLVAVILLVLAGTVFTTTRFLVPPQEREIEFIIQGPETGETEFHVQQGQG